MAKQKIVNIHKVTQQHGSAVVVIPIIVRTALQIDPGDYMVFVLDRDTNKVVVSKFGAKGFDYVPDH